jgi:hypothetical protein
MDENRAIEEFLTKLRPLVIQLFKAGAAAERVKMLSLLGADLPVKSEGLPTVNERFPQYGAVTKNVRNALASLSAVSPDGVDSAAIHEACPALTAMQIRTALKQLAKLGDAVRVSRGSYLPATAGGEPGVVAPGPVTHSQSVEAASGGSKGHGFP